MEYQLCHKLEEISEIGFKINWCFIKIGYLGYEYLQTQLTKQDICEYGYNILEKIESSYDLLTQLLGESSNDYVFEEILEKLAREERTDTTLQVRKWIVYLTKNMISNLREDYFENLLTITDFWVSLGIPQNTPHIFQAVNNKITPKEYYTKEMHDLIIDKHMQWIDNEIKQISLLEQK